MTKPDLFPVLNNQNQCRFRLYAPHARQVSVVLGNGDREEPLESVDKGYWEATIEDIREGQRYAYRVDDADPLPDPASLSQPDGVHEPSEVIRLDRFHWKDGSWENVPLKKMIIYELHTGTFTPDGTFGGIMDKLDYLSDLGVNALEIMPVARFSGDRNWGYDGVYPFAVQESYGGARGLMELVNACHNRGIAVILDVVYNHLGPEGNYLEQYGPYFSGNYSTPWGKPLNFDGPHSDAVRNFFIQNALMWCRNFHIDALRLDAVHAIYDFSARHLLQELAENLQELSGKTGKDHYLIAESNLNDVRHIKPIRDGGLGMDSQWSDDFHHSLHALATGERHGYYMDFGKEEQLEKAMTEGFVYDGDYSGFRKKSFGSRSADLPGERFVVFSQNHDQTGNRKNGERLISLAGFDWAKLAAAFTLLTPHIPMLFMGEEYGEENPFLYFVSHRDKKLNEQVRKGREREFREFHEGGDPAPDPASPGTFERSRLAWDFEEREERGAMLEFYRELIRLRKNHPALSNTDRERQLVHRNGSVFILERWQDEARVLALFNLGSETTGVTVPHGIRGTLERIIDSSSVQWAGTGESSLESVTANDRVPVPAGSVVIYSNHTL